MTATIAESLSTSSVDLQTLLELSRRTDPVGVLSIYLDARPGALRAASIEASVLCEADRGLEQALHLKRRGNAHANVGTLLPPVRELARTDDFEVLRVGDARARLIQKEYCYWRARPGATSPDS